MCNVRAENRNSPEELQKRLKLKNMTVCLHDYNGLVIYKEKRVLGLVKVESGIVGGSLPKGQTRKTRNEETRKGLIKWRISLLISSRTFRI